MDAARDQRSVQAESAAHRTWAGAERFGGRLGGCRALLNQQQIAAMALPGRGAPRDHTAPHAACSLSTIQLGGLHKRRHRTGGCEVRRCSGWAQDERAGDHAGLQPACRRRLRASRAAQKAQHHPACLLQRRIGAAVVLQPRPASPLTLPASPPRRRSRRPAWPPPSAASSCRRGASWRGPPPAPRWRSSARRRRRRPRRSRIACASSTCPRSPAPRRTRTGRAAAMAPARCGGGNNNRPAAAAP